MNWGNIWEEVAGQVLAGLVIVPIALWLEAWLDERREKRHKR